MDGNASCRRVVTRRRISPGTSLAVFLLGIALIGCRQSPREPVTLRYSYSWNEDRPKARALLQQFTQETGIRVKSIPIPEATREYVDLARKLLEDGSGADLLNIDLIWAPILEPYLIDLQPFLAAEISLLEPQLLPSYTVNGKLVAVPFNVPLGGLEYRTDLLREYGYDHPPKTWNELESMAERIQVGERAKGAKDFWGYVWQGNAGEALTCNALEWQVAAGGGRIIEPDRTISVNNPAAIRAWQQAKRIPGGVEGSAGTLGGTGTAVSLHSTHRQEAIALLRFQLRALMQASEKEGDTGGPTQAQFFEPPSISDPRVSPVASNQRASIVARPSIAAGSTYKQVSRAYIDAVHSVLTGQRRAPEVAAELEKQLIEITGFSAGPPKMPDKMVR